MVGVKGRSGPPGHKNSIGNSGGKAGRSGPPLNANARRHGLYSPRSPKGSAYIDRSVGIFKRKLESQILAAFGEISILNAALVQTCCEATRVAMAELSELKTLREKLEPLHLTTKRQSALKALDLRDKKIRELGITWQPNADDDVADPWKDFDESRQLDGLPSSPNEPTTAPTAEASQTSTDPPATRQAQNPEANGHK